MPDHETAGAHDVRPGHPARDDHTVRVWDLDLDRVVDRICATASPPLTAAERDAHFPGLPFRAPCP